MNPLMEHCSCERLKRKMPAYLVASLKFKTDYSSVNTSNHYVLHFRKGTSHRDLEDWRKAAIITFTMSIYSASSERVW